MAEPLLENREVRRLALACAGLLSPRWSQLPTPSSYSSASHDDSRKRTGNELDRASRATAQSIKSIIDRFGYLQLDSVSIAGARKPRLGIDVTAAAASAGDSGSATPSH